MLGIKNSGMTWPKKKKNKKRQILKTNICYFFKGTMLKKTKRNNMGRMHKFLKPQGKQYLVSFYMILNKN